MLLVLRRPSTLTHAVEPPRSRAARRRSLRSTLTTAGYLVAAISLLNGIEVRIQSPVEARALLGLSLVQAAAALAVVYAMRTPLRRRPAAVAFAFLLIVPIVPLLTVMLDPIRMQFVSASLALIPIAVALFLRLTNRMFATWLALSLVAVSFLSKTWLIGAVSGAEASQLVLATLVGSAFAAVGQIRREANDRLSFERENALRRLYRQTAEQRRALARLNDELDRSLKREVRGRESIDAALASIPPGADPESVAAAACLELTTLPSVDAAWVIALTTEVGQLLASNGTGPGADVGALIGPASLARLAEAAATGHRSAGSFVAMDGAGVAQLAGFEQTVWCAFGSDERIVGLIGCGARDGGHADGLQDVKPAIATYASMVGALVSTAIEERIKVATARERIRAVLDSRAYRPFLQPIAELRTGRVVGYEALTRFGDGTRPDIMFGLAARAELGVPLEQATIAAAIEASRSVPRGPYLSLNASPGLLYGRGLRDLMDKVDRPVVLEITEHEAIDDYGRLREAIRELGPDVQLAVDDAGAGYASLRHILELDPDCVKLDIGLVRGIDADPARQALIAGVRSFAKRRQMRLVAEGIETHAELGTLRAIGVAYGQGYLLGRPQDAGTVNSWPSRVDLAAVA